MKIDELKVGSLLQLNEAGRKHFSGEDPEATLLVLKTKDNNQTHATALLRDIPDIMVFYCELQYWDVISDKKED